MDDKPKKKFTLAQLATIMAIVVPLVSFGTWAIGKVATKHQVAEIRNELLIKHTETQISLLELKNTDVNFNEWSMEDKRKYDDLREDSKKYEAIRKELSGIPEGLPD